MADRNIPGLQAAVIQDGKIIFSRSYGVANLQTPIPVTASTVFTVNSITKAFTGVAVMREVERGRLDLSAPISKYLDDIPASWGPVTILQLMGEISGLPDFYAYAGNDLIGITDEQKAWAWASTQPVSPPGEAESYCQTNLTLVQRIINKIEGRPQDSPIILDELARAETVQTAFGDSQDVIKDKSQPYRFLNAEGVLRNHFERFGPMMHANSGLNSTADDMARWMISVLDGRQLGDKARQRMWTAVSMNDGKPSSFAIGWGVAQRAHYVSVGMTGGGRSAFSIYPRYHLGVVILTNLLGANPEDLTDEIAANFAPEIKLSGVDALRAKAERNGFADLSSLLSAARTGSDGRSFDEGELEDWIRDLLWSGSLPRALELARFNTELFPTSITATEYLGKAYSSNGKLDEAKRLYGDLNRRDPRNAAARAYLRTH